MVSGDSAWRHSGSSEVPADAQHAFARRHADQIARARGERQRVAAIQRQWHDGAQLAARVDEAEAGRIPCARIRGDVARRGEQPARAGVRGRRGADERRGQVGAGQAAQWHLHRGIVGAIGLDERKPGGDRIAPECALGVDRQLAIAAKQREFGGARHAGAVGAGRHVHERQLRRRQGQRQRRQLPVRIGKRAAAVATGDELVVAGQRPAMFRQTVAAGEDRSQHLTAAPVDREGRAVQVRHEQMIDARCRLVGDDGRYELRRAP